MLIEAQLSEDAIEASGGGFGHRGIVKHRCLPKGPRRWR
jgi:hypothetical protein